MTRLVVLSLLFITRLLCCAETHDDSAGKPALDILDADLQLPHTAVVPTLEAKHETGKNLIYCATLQLAWNEFIALMGGPVELEKNPPAAQKLNKREFRKEMIDAESVFVFSGSGPDAPKLMAEELQKKFNGGASPKLIPEKLLTNEFVLYGYLYKKLEFTVPLYPYPDGFDFCGGNVKTFGIAMDNPGRGKMTRCVRAHDYIDKDNFVIELLNKGSTDRVYVAKIQPERTLQKTTESVLKRLNETNRSTLEDGEDIRIPTFNFELVKSFGDLAPLKLYNKAWEQPGELKECTQLIRLKLDEYGAVLKSETRVRGSPGLADPDGEPPPPPPPRHFICDKPFLVLMIRKDETMPYFAMWVDNPEMLVKSDVKPTPPVKPAAPVRKGSVGGTNVDD